MTGHGHSHEVSLLGKISVCAAVSVFGIGCLVLAGWIFNIPALKSFILLQMAFFLCLAWIIAVMLNRADAERRRTGDALRESEEKYRIIVENAAEGIWIVDKNYITTFVNKKLADMLGYEVDEIIGSMPYDFIDSEYRVTVALNLEKRKAGLTQQSDIKMLRKDGSDLWILSHASPILDKDGNYAGALTMITDITGRKMMEEENTILARFPSENPNPVLRLSREGAVIFANEESDALMKMWNCSVGDAIPEQWRRAVALAYDEGLVKVVDIECLDRVYSFNIVPIAYADYVNMYGSDITERKRAENALRETRDYLDNLIDHANAPIIVWDPFFRITRFNRAFETLTGFESGDVAGKHLDMLFPENSRNESMKLIRAALSGELWKAVEIPILRRDGNIRIALWNSANIHDKNGSVISSIAQGQDITERKQAEADLRETRDYLDNLIDHANAPIIVWDPFFSITRFNRAFEVLTGLEAGSVLGKHLDMLFPDGSRIESMKLIRAALSGEHWKAVEIPILRKDGSIRIALWNSANIHDKNGSVISTIAQGQDITKRKKQEEELHKLNRILKALSSSSQAMSRTMDENDYLREVCRFIERDCGYSMVWIGFAGTDEAKSVRPVAYAGFEEGYIETLKITWADTERGQGPTGMAIRSGKARMCRNMLSDPDFYPWRKEALKRGYAASIALPLIMDDRAFGALTIYSKEPDPFSDDEVKLLTELAGDLAYGIKAIRLRIAHAKAEAALRESETRYRELFNTMSDGVMLHEMIYDEAQGVPVNYIIINANPAVEKHLGIPPREAIGKDALELFGTLQAPYLDIYERVSSTGGSARFETYFAPMNKYFSISVFSPSPGKFATVFKDITEEKIAGMKLEQLVKERTAELSMTNESLKEEILRRGVLEMEKEKAYEDLDLIFNSTDVGMLLIDINFTVIRVNKRFIDLFSLDKEGVIGKKCHDILNLEMCNSENCTIECLKAGKKDVVFEMTYAGRAGMEIICQASAVPFYSHSGEMIGMLQNFVDVTEKREIQRRLISIIDEERKRISHDLHDELGQNLTALGFLVESVRQKLAAESEEFAPKLAEIANLIQVSQRQTRTMSRVLSPVEIDRNGLITSIETMAANVKQVYGLDCAIDIDGDCTIDDNSIATNLYYIVREAVNNSLKHGKPGAISVRLYSDEDFMYIEVHDNGSGMASETSGGGMGLKIMKYRAEIIGAIFNYGNCDGGGFSIFVRMPR